MINSRISNFSAKNHESEERKQQRKLIRQNIICYFLAMAQGHQAVQQLQQEIIMHPYFNPVLLFRKFTKSQYIKQRDYLDYIVNQMGISSVSVVETYLRKHDLGKKIDCEQFIASILPYSPDILRNSYATIVWQVKSSPSLKRDILYFLKEVIKTEIFHILNVSSFRKNINLSWKQLKHLIETDLKHNSNYVHPQGEFDIMTVRKWMQLWIDVHEKDVLNMMRWMKGGFEEHMVNNYNDIFVQNVVCTCNWIFTSGIELKQPQPKSESSIILNFSSKPLSRRQSQMYQRKISYMENQGCSTSTLSHKMSCRSSIKSTCRVVSPQRSNSLVDTKSVKSIQSVTYNIKNSKTSWSNSIMGEKAVSLWCQYISTILNGESNLSEKRQKLKGYIERIEQFLKQGLMSKKKTITKIVKIIAFIQKNTNLSKISKKLMEQCLSHLSIENSVILSIFSINKQQTQQQKPQQNKNKSPSKGEGTDFQVSSKSLKKQIADVLKNYCLTKCRLIKISQQMMHINLAESLFKILDNKNLNYLRKQDLVQKMTEMKIQYKEGDVQTLMRHFGDGNMVSRSSFTRVFQIQSM